MTTDEDGEYSYVWAPPGIGSYVVKANWTGDAYTFPFESSPQVVACTRTPTIISILTDYSSNLSGFEVEVSGTLLDIYGRFLKLIGKK